MKFKTLSTVMLLTFIAIVGFSASAEARCHKSFGFSVGGCGPCAPCYAPVYVQQPVYVPPPAYAAPVYVPPPAYAVYPQPVYVCPPQPNYYSSFSFGMSFR